MENKFIPDEAHDENYDDNFENFIQSDQPQNFSKLNTHYPVRQKILSQIEFSAIPN